jgi:hypothetical protein
MADAPVWPRPFVVFANRRVWDNLDAGQRAVLRDAAENALPSCPERRATSGAERFPSEFARGPTTVYGLQIDPARACTTVHHDDGYAELGFDDQYTVYRDRVTFLGGELEFSARWKLDGNRLTFSDFESAEPGDRFVWGTHPWVRVGR